MSKLIQNNDFKRLENKAYSYRFGKNWSDWGLLFRFLIVICKLLDKDKPTKKKSDRKKSAWNVFMSEKMKEGKTMKEVAELYKKKS